MELAPADWEIEVPVKLTEEDKAAIARAEEHQRVADLEALKTRLEEAHATVIELEAAIAARSEPIVVEEPGQGEQEVPHFEEAPKEETPAKEEKPKPNPKRRNKKVDTKPKSG